MQDLSDLYEIVFVQRVAIAAIGVGVFMGIVWLIRYFSPTFRTVTIFIAFGLELMLLVVLFAAPGERWGCVLALLPGVLILQHAVFLRLVRMPFRSKSDPNRTSGTSDAEAVGRLATDQELLPVFTAARKNSERYFSPSTLAIRYGTPAVSTAIVGITVYYLLFVDKKGTDLNANIKAARLGVTGAYTYVLLYLGQRNFRQDVTSGGAMWCAIMLALGPVLAWSISHFSNGDLQAKESPSLSSEMLFFAAGLVPRSVAAFVAEAVRRLWVSPSNITTAVPRTAPVTQVRGITPDIAERLSEEGIQDLHGLASADPLKLLRNTNFDKRQIISWIDEAILITVLPDNWQLLEKQGYTGAIDVAWLHPAMVQEVTKSPPPDSPTQPALVDLSRLAQLIKLDDVSTLYGVIDRLYTDAQLRLVWVLYQAIDQIDARNDEEDDDNPLPEKGNS